MSLKTDYKEDVFTGRRKYNMIQNGDETVSFEDVTDYSQLGDTFGAGDINATNAAINNISADHTGTASTTGTRSQIIKDAADVAHEIDGTKYMEATASLSMFYDTTFTFRNAAITANSVITVRAGRASGDVADGQNIFSVKNIYTVAGQCNVVFPPFESAIALKVRIYIQ